MNLVDANTISVSWMRGRHVDQKTSTTSEVSERPTSGLRIVCGMVNSGAYPMKEIFGFRGRRALLLGAGDLSRVVTNRGERAYALWIGPHRFQEHD